MGTSTAPMARAAKSVTAHSQRFSAMRAMRSPFCAPQPQKGRGQRADALIDLVRGDGLPLAKLVLPEDGAGVGGRGYAAKEVVDGGDRSDLSHWFDLGSAETSPRGHSRVYQRRGHGAQPAKWDESARVPERGGCCILMHVRCIFIRARFPLRGPRL